MLAASASITVCVERKHNRPLLLQGRRHKMTEGNFQKGTLPEAAVLLEGDVKKRATLKETVRIRHVIIGILPYVKITKLIRDANLAESAYSSTLRLKQTTQHISITAYHHSTTNNNHINRVLSPEGYKWSVRFDVRDLGGHLDTTFRGWSAAVAARVRLVISRLDFLNFCTSSGLSWSGSCC